MTDVSCQPDSPGLSLEAQETLVQALKDPACYPHPVDTIELIETHISWVLLAGEFAYKLKKNIHFGFVDFSTLAQRQHCCEEELRLNRRQAADLYLEVVAIGGTLASPRLGSPGAPLEYAVKMRRFDQRHLLRERLQRGEISSQDIEVLAQTLARFHQSIARPDSVSTYGCTDDIRHYTLENISALAPLLRHPADTANLARYARWVETRHEQLQPLFEARHRQGFVRECHGDLHLGNITFNAGHFCFFDCIEFNPDLRWVDVVSELAFLAMDLESSGHLAFSRQLIDAYFAVTGDYAGVPLLPYYLAYRAMVRAKVAMLQRQQALDASSRDALTTRVHDYLALAVRYTTPHRPVLMITHGLSGSGKSTHTRPLIELLGAIRLRSDVERKRLFALEEHTDSASAARLYSADATRTTYAHLLKEALALLAAGYPVIIDATFLQRWQRDMFRQAAETKGLPFYILDFSADLATLEQRILTRQQQGLDPSDATLAVLHQQHHSQEALAADEQACLLRFDPNDQGNPWQALQTACCDQ